jgi:hypothetical protein
VGSETPCLQVYPSISEVLERPVLHRGAPPCRRSRCPPRENALPPGDLLVIAAGREPKLSTFLRRISVDDRALAPARRRLANDRARMQTQGLRVRSHLQGRSAADSTGPRWPNTKPPRRAKPRKAAAGEKEMMPIAGRSWRRTPAQRNRTPWKGATRETVATAQAPPTKRSGGAMPNGSPSNAD